MMRRLTHYQAMGIADALDLTPEVIASDGKIGEVHLLVPNFSAEDAAAFIEVVTGGIHVEPAGLQISDDAIEGSDMPCARIVIHTED